MTKKKQSNSGIISLVAFVLVIGLVIEFWYVVLPLAILGGGAYAYYRVGENKKTASPPGAVTETSPTPPSEIHYE